ncbi:hypothetical protein B0H17DRAFT_1185187 [Mycena rosella]|uniref:Uncharacterized protein n=1 Tax=Mycena rosella TaxID=1033263 RepID=A0AAD7CT23_MYCRO|nr:hypothetical protein B0H17DRAFT_1185187 [Mycena rosella]
MYRSVPYGRSPCLLWPPRQAAKAAPNIFVATNYQNREWWVTRKVRAELEDDEGCSPCPSRRFDGFRRRVADPFRQGLEETFNGTVTKRISAPTAVEITAVDRHLTGDGSEYVEHLNLRIFRPFWCGGGHSTSLGIWMLAVPFDGIFRLVEKLELNFNVQVDLKERPVVDIFKASPGNELVIRCVHISLRVSPRDYRVVDVDGSSEHHRGHQGISLRLYADQRGRAEQSEDRQPGKNLGVEHVRFYRELLLV